LHYHKNCAELNKSGDRISGVYAIDPDGSGAFDVFCDQATDGGGWKVFQKRLDCSVDLNMINQSILWKPIFVKLLKRCRYVMLQF